MVTVAPLVLEEAVKHFPEMIRIGFKFRFRKQHTIVEDGLNEDRGELTVDDSAKQSRGSF